jgi:hypothetical protein
MPKHRRPPIPAGNVYLAVPPRPYVFWVWLGLAALCAVVAFHVPKPPEVPLLEFKFEFGAFLAAAVLLSFTAFSSASHRVEIHGTILRIYGGFYYRNVKADDLDIAAARVVDLTTDKELRPVWWLCGVGLPGYSAGLCLLRGEGQAWAFLTDRRSVLWLPRKKGRPYLLSLADNAGLLARLQKYASRPTAGGEK